MLSIPEYYILKKKQKQRSLSAGPCALPYPKAIFLTTKIAPEKKVLGYCRGPHYPLLKKIIMSQEDCINVYSYWWEGVKGEPDFSLVPKQKHILSCLNRTQFYYLDVWTPGKCSERVVEMFNPLHTVLSNLFFLTWLEEGGLGYGLQWCLPTVPSAELHKVPMFQLLQCIEGLWTGTIWHMSLSSQFCVISKLGEGTLSHHPAH